MRAIFEETRDIILGVQNYEGKSKDIRETQITESAGYTNTMTATIKYSYDYKLKRNRIHSIFVQQTQRY